MKLLADMGVSMSTVEALRREGHDLVHLAEVGLSRSEDPDILDRARVEQRVVLTFDVGFSDLLAAGLQTSPSVIIFRLRTQTPDNVTPKAIQILTELAPILGSGAIVVVEEGRFRVRRLPVAPAGP